MSDDDKAAIMQLSVHLYGLTAAVRALISTHQDPERARLLFDQLSAQMLAHPAFLGDKKSAQTLKDFAEVLFRPPVSLDTED